MKHYNTGKRRTYKQHKQYSNHTQPHRDTHTYTIQPRYDGYNSTIYTTIIARNQRNTQAKRYVDLVNIVKAISTPEAPQTYLPTATYRIFIPTAPEPPLTRPIQEEETHTDTKTVKCIIYDSTGTRVIYYGTLERTIEYTLTSPDISITLHKSNRTFRVYPYTPPDDTIHNVPIKDIRKHNVEFYHI